jgi:predicted nucleic acid-binding protein
MAGVFAAILDTCVLWPSLQRDFLLSMAVEGLYRPLWSEAILAELHEHEREKHLTRGATPGEAASRAEHLLTQMRTHFDDAMVTGWEALEGTYGLRDPDDEHVVAAAVVGGAGVIVTSDHDFEPAKVPARILVSTPAQFAADTVDVDPLRAVVALTQIAARSHNPGLSVEALLVLLRDRYGMHEAVDLITPYID